MVLYEGSIWSVKLVEQRHHPAAMPTDGTDGDKPPSG
jgi:hypothetical protein